MQQTIQKQTHKPKQKNAWKYILSVIILLIYILPIYVLVNMAFKHPTDLGSRLLPPTYFDISNFTSIIESGKLFRALGNTVLIAVGTVAIEVVFGCMAAYAFARNRSRLNSFMQSFYDLFAKRIRNIAYSKLQNSFARMSGKIFVRFSVYSVKKICIL